MLNLEFSTPLKGVLNCRGVKMLKDTVKREAEVLAIIVSCYAETAEPVGSRFVSRRLGLSSATIRNVMSDLEELGLITQPHTSAGRIPTDKGYRYYIDSLMRIKNVNEHIIKEVRDEYYKAMRSLEDVMERTSHIISSLTNYVGITAFPQYDKLYLEGTSHIIEQPEFQDLKKLYAIMKFLEQKQGLLRFLNADPGEEKLTVHIGKENKFSYLNDCSVVTRGCKVRGKLSGRIGVIGPKRMGYDKIIPMMEFLADTVADILDKFDVEKA